METLYKKMKRNNKYALTTTLNPTLIRYIQRVTLAFPDQHSQLFVATAIQTLVAAEHINIPKKLFQYISSFPPLTLYLANVLLLINCIPCVVLSTPL